MAEVAMSYRIVVADKDPVSREAVARFLAQQDAEFVNVSSSGELKQAIKSHKPDLIILNALLSDAPGWKISERIKGSKDYADVPVILMTGDPGSPSAEQARTSLADHYVTKPIDGSALTLAVASFLGTSGLGAEEEEDEELVIDFSDDDSGDMTEELLAMSSEALEAKEPTTDVGDTVEIDAGTLSAEVESAVGVDDEEEYGDTVRLNLDDLGLEDQDEDAPALEPTIELVPDLPTMPEESAVIKPAGRVVADVGAKQDAEGLPDFASITSEATAGRAGKDSITVDLDVDDLSLELGDEMLERPAAHEEHRRFDADDTEIGDLLEVQKPSEIITSEDVMVQDDSLVQETLSDSQLTGVEVIDLEEDQEIADIEMEQLEAIDVEPLREAGQDMDATTVPMASLEMEQLAQEDLEEITLDDTEETALTTDRAVSTYETADELSLEEITEEEMSTEEFFGEELPTEEFPTERFPKEETEELSLEQEITLEATEEGEVEIQPERVRFEEVTLDTDSAEEILAEYRGEEPVLEVTEDISLEGIALEEEVPPLRPEAAVTPTAPPKPEEAPPAREREQVGPGVLAGVVGAAGVAGLAAAAAAAAKAGPAPAEPAAPLAPPEAMPAAHGYVPDKGDWMQMIEKTLREVLSAKADLRLAADAAAKDYLPSKEELSAMVGNSLRELLPSRAEMIGAFERAIADSLPDRGAILAQIDKQVTACLPAQEQIFQRIDNALQGFRPSSEMFSEVMDKAILAFPTRDELMKHITQSLGAIPSSEDVLSRLEGALATAIPTRDQAEARFWSSLDGKIERVVSEADLSSSIRELLPKAEDMVKGWKEALPDKDRFQETIAQGLAQAIENSLPERMWLESVSRGLFDERTKGLLPDRQEVVAMLREEIQLRLLDTVEKIVKEQIERITADLES
jgi:CheY-like chemotaxis protein